MRTTCRTRPSNTRWPGDDPELAVRVFERFITIKLNSAELNDVARWLDAVPPEWFSAYPVMDLCRAGLLMFTGDFDACLRCIDDVEARLAQAWNEETRSQQAIATALRCFLACVAERLAAGGGPG